MIRRRFFRVSLLLLAASCICFLSPIARAQDTAATDKAFTVVLLPDTQFYSEKYPDNYVAQEVARGLP